MHKIGNIIEKFFLEKGLTDILQQQKIIHHWNEIVGEKISDQSRAESIENGILRVRVKDSVWINHLLLLKPQIIMKINTYVKKNIIKDLYFFLGEINGGKN